MSRTPAFRPPAPFRDREQAGKLLASALDRVLDRHERPVLVGLARGGVVVAAAVAEELQLPLDALGVRKVRHLWQPEYAIGAVAPGREPYLRSHDGLSRQEVNERVEFARREAEELQARLHERWPELDPAGRAAVLVDDGLATGATMVAAVRWARSRGAARVLAAVPVGATATVGALSREADGVVCPYVTDEFGAVGLWYENFSEVYDQEVLRLLEAARRRGQPN